MIYYLPLEHIEKRYTVHLDKQITDYLNSSGLQFMRIYPGIKKGEIKQGSFLDAPFTIRFKMLQIERLALLYENNIIKDDDIIFISDLWMPGIESIAYMNYFCGKDVKIRGILHAGSFTDTDFVRDMERWACLFENIIFDIVDKIYVGSNFIKNDVYLKRLVDKSKIEVTPFPLDYENLSKYKNKNKKNIVVFNGRNVDEKQPHLFFKMKSILKEEAEFINTQLHNFSKKEYYKILSEAKVVISFALQENYGFGINEAVYLGCTPVLPNRLVYPELYNDEFLYNTFDEAVEKVKVFLKNPKKINLSNYLNSIEEWFR